MTQKPEDFYCSPEDTCTPIIALDKKGFDAWSKNADKTDAAQAASQGFAGAEGDMAYITGPNGDLTAVLSGLGPVDRAAKLGGLALRLPEGNYEFEATLSKDETAQAALYWATGQYRFGRYLKKPGKAPRRLKLSSSVNGKRTHTLVQSIFLVRDLINTPPNDMGPDELAAAAEIIAKEFSASLNVIVGDDLLKANLPAIHAVGRAAEVAPRLIDMTWGNASDPKVTLVGKGVTFDTGGLDLKSAAGMFLMKKDMGGGALVLGLARVIMAMALPIRLRVLIPAVENSVAGNAYRPSDIIPTRKGISVEIGNTDAEGRVVLCDALALGDEEKPDLMLDFATLTGAAMIGLGSDLGALFANDEKLAQGLLKGGEATGDPMWRMPLWQPYREALKSEPADLNNMANTSYGGAITAALYLEHFVETAKAWAHMDVYCWRTAAKPARPKGAEAHSLLATFSYLENRFGK